MPSAALKGERVALARRHRARLGGVTDTNHRGVDMSAFDGRTVVVTGASGGLGAGVTAAFAAAGARVVGVAQREPAADRRVDRVRYAAADLTDDDAVAALFDGIGTPWAVAHTVGGYAPATPLSKIDAGELAQQLTLNLTTSALVVKHALRVMQPAAAGRIVLTASRSATVTAGAGFAYSVSKLGVLHLTRMAADEVAGSGITVNCVVPSIIDTAANRAGMPKADHSRWPKPADIAGTYLFLADPASGLVNGATVPV
jgi:NAD(P)-dependent dehydrogenase (short-subunit alcohol dehydrogenase family)